MTARDVDDAAKRLGELKAQAIEDAALAAAAFALALAATQYRPTLAMPLALGAIAMVVLAGRAFVRRFLLVDELAAEPAAYCIPAVHEFGERAASIEHRRVLASTVRAVFDGEPEVERLVRALEDESASWEPQTVVALDHWLAESPEELGSRARSILARLDQ